ncbi:MAG: 4Fe-4S dicluster domain-containing protein [Defluviitaleaceae bacterium]|nr:4Fe-4S dicluster domain-containing protein [Defluviitaleaceae bacterium]
MYKILLEDLPKLYAQMAQNADVYMPLRRGNELNFEKWNNEAIVDLESLKTVNTPKDLFLPQIENLYSSQVVGTKINIENVPVFDKTVVLFGVKACDVRAIEVLDNVYLQGDFVDEFYKARREKSIIISLACNTPAKTCFCSAFDIDPSSPQSDVRTWICNEYMYFDFTDEKHEKYERFYDMIKEFLTEADESEVAPLQKEIQEKINTLPFSGICLEKFTPENMLSIFNSSEWEHLYRPCIGCGTCTYSCPTCQCYDIRDHQSKCGGILKYRCWDSCMYPDFTLMAHGNPRFTQKERFRQRFMHKLLYHPEKYDGQFGCVGCGRCVNKCPVSLNILKVIKTIGGDENDTK